jgi:hypothetical protein
MISDHPPATRTAPAHPGHPAHTRPPSAIFRRMLSEPRTALPWIDRGLIAAFIVTALIFAAIPFVNSFRPDRHNKDYILWYATAQVVRHGGVIYPKDGRLFPFMYPPSCAALLAVGGVLGEHTFVAALALINSAAWLGAILLAVSLVTGQAFRQHPLLYMVPTLCVLPYVHDTYLIGQPNLLLLTLMLGAFACLRRGREGAAGGLIGLAAAIKAFPFMAIGYLIYRRYWKATLVLAATLVFLLLVLPVEFRSPAQAWDDLVTWTRGMVLKYDADGIAQRPERCYSYKNQSAMALANRLLRPVSADGEDDATWKVNIADLDFHAVNAVIAALALGLGLFTLATMPPHSRRTAQTDAIEWAMILLLILMFSPLSFNYFFVWLLYPIAVALHLVLSAPPRSAARRARLVWLGLALAPLAATAPLLRLAQAYGSLFFTSLVLLVGLGWSLRHQPTAAPAT